MSKQTTKTPLIVEGYPKDYVGFPFLSLIEFRGEHLLAIIDVATNSTVSAYILDLCETTNINPLTLVELLDRQWDNLAKAARPVSTVFALAGLSRALSPLYRTYTTTEITRIIGRYPTLDVSQPKTVKRRRRREVDLSCVKVVRKT